MNINKLRTIHPFLFTIFPVLFLFAYNIDEVPAIDIILPLIIVILGTSVLFFMLKLVTRSYIKSGIITSFFLILFFSFGHVRVLILSLVEEDIPTLSIYLACIWTVFFVIGTFLIIKSHRNFLNLNKFLNIVAVTLVVVSLINITVYQIKALNNAPDEGNQESYSLKYIDSDDLPDIFYIILDQYANSSTLKDYYDYDNSDFIDFLTSMGFYVASGSRGNYSLTFMSLASSLNMEYINYLSETVGVNSRDKTIPIRMLQNNKVSLFLKSKGYRYIFISGGYFEKGMSKYAEVYSPDKSSFGIKITKFAYSFIQTTALAPFVNTFERIFDINARGKILYSFDTLANMPNVKGPKFVLAHILCPHPPFVFDCNGNPASTQPDVKPERRYLDQLIFTTKKVKGVIEEIITKSQTAPIIILQSDTGPGSGGQLRGEDSMTQIEESMKILNAYFLPGYDDHFLYETIAPVNTFRIVFNLYFDTNYELLEDVSYYSTKGPYQFITVPPELNSPVRSEPLECDH